MASGSLTQRFRRTWGADLRRQGADTDGGATSLGLGGCSGGHQRRICVSWSERNGRAEKVSPACVAAPFSLNATSGLPDQRFTNNLAFAPVQVGSYAIGTRADVVSGRVFCRPLATGAKDLLRGKTGQHRCSRPGHGGFDVVWSIGRWPGKQESRMRDEDDAGETWGKCRGEAAQISGRKTNLFSGLDRTRSVFRNRLDERTAYGSPNDILDEFLRLAWVSQENFAESRDPAECTMRLRPVRGRRPGVEFAVDAGPAARAGNRNVGPRVACGPGRVGRKGGPPNRAQTNSREQDGPAIRCVLLAHPHRHRPTLPGRQP